MVCVNATKIWIGLLTAQIKLNAHVKLTMLEMDNVCSAVNWFLHAWSVKMLETLSVIVI